MPGLDSPLQVIKQKESDLRQEVEAARRETAARLRVARAEAEQMVRDADAGGRAEAAADYQARIEQTHQEAKAITTAASEETAAMRRLAMSRLDDVAKQIAEWVYAPSNGESSDHRGETVSG
jgi:vacuolar-type H+-ATPase subunit H